MGIFDIDSGTDNHLLNEQFHVFSKSPASVATALGDASNRSGHTVTASDVWGQEIPAFFYAKTQAVADSYKSLAKTNDLCRIGNSVAIFENGNWVVKYNSYTDIPDGHKFKNANGDEVIRFHKNRLAYNLNLDNNAADDGLNTTAKIQGWDEENGKVYDYVATAPKFVTQFVTSTDKIVDGIPSKGFGPFVMAGTTTGDITKVLPEGTSDQNHYIANSFAGIIQFNKARTDAIYVHAFEYCGKTLKSAYSDIIELDEKLSKISVTAAGGVQAVSDAAMAAGLEIDSIVVGGVTTPTLDITTAAITDGIFTSTTGNKARLVTADALEKYVAKNAKVSVNGQSATTIAVAGTSANSADLVKIVVTEDKTTTDKIGLTLTATTDVATVTSGVITSGHEGKLVKAGDAKDIVDTAIAALSADGGAIATLTTRVGEAEANAAASASAASASQTAAEGAKSEAAASKSAAEAAQTAAEGAQSAAQAAQAASETAASNASASAQAASKSASDASASATSASQSASAATAAQTAAEAAQSAAEAAKEFVETTAVWQAGTEDTLGNFTTNASGVVTGTTVKTVADEVLTLAKSYSDSLHTTSLDYVVLGDSETLPTASADTLGKIYLVASQNSPAADGAAISGAYVEYMTRKVGEGDTATYTWEKIGTTAADLSAYAKTADLNATNVGTGAVKVSQTDGVVSSVTVATEALVSNNAIKTSVTDANALVKASDALEAIKLAKPESYIKSVKARQMVGSNSTISSSGESNITVTTYGGYDGAVFTLDANTNTLSLDYAYAGKLTSSCLPNFTSDGQSRTKLFGVYNNTIIKHNNYFDLYDSFDSLVYDKVLSSDLYDGNPDSYFCDTNKIVEGSTIFANKNEFKYFHSKLDNLKQGPSMFYNTSLSEFIIDMPSLFNAYGMFMITPEADPCLTTFIGDLSSLRNAGNMFSGQEKLTTFISDLGSLHYATSMFSMCSLNTESVECIADTICDVLKEDGYSGIVLDIGIGNEMPSDREIMAFNTIHSKGWNVYVNGSKYTPTEPSAITTTDENGEVRTTPIPFYAKAVEVSEADAEYVDNAGKFYRVLGGQYIYVNDPETYGMFTCLEDAVANMRLTKYVKPENEA